MLIPVCHYYKLRGFKLYTILSTNCQLQVFLFANAMISFYIKMQRISLHVATVSSICLDLHSKRGHPSSKFLNVFECKIIMACVFFSAKQSIANALFHNVRFYVYILCFHQLMSLE